MVKHEAEVVEYSGSDKEYEIPSHAYISPSDNDVYRIVAIGGNAFYENKHLVSVTIPGTVKTIGFQAFSCCRNLSNVVLCEGLETIGAWAFLGCERLCEIKIPKSVKHKFPEQ